MIVEIVIYTGFVIFLFFYVSSATRALSLLGFMATSVLLEVMNISFFHQQGTVYPESIFYFPGYKFPVAIILFSAIYGGFIGLLSLKIVNFFKPGFGKTVFILTAAVLNLLSVFVEKAGIMTGYWIHQKAQNINDIWYYVYLFYFAVILGGIVFLFDEIKNRT